MWVHALAQPNIALVKYWGKRDIEENLPAVGSLSMTLDTLYTRMSVRLPGAATADTLTVNGAASEHLLPRVSKCLDGTLGHKRAAADVVSESNFPLAAGLASSSSSFAALVMAASHAAGFERDTLALARLAGAASGSAARSFYDGLVELRVGDDAIDLSCIAGPESWPLAIVVAVTNDEAKSVASGAAMLRSAATSPFYGGWLRRQDADLASAREAVRARDFEQLAAVSEHNCLKMHSLMWTSRPPVVYWNEATLNAMEAVRDLERQGVPVFFTIDAGPQVKAVCLPEARDAVAAALEATAGVRKVLICGLGRGARLVADS